MTKEIYINAPLTRRVLSYFIDWYLGALLLLFQLLWFHKNCMEQC